MLTLTTYTTLGTPVKWLRITADAILAGVASQGLPFCRDKGLSRLQLLPSTLAKTPASRYINSSCYLQVSQG
ncbi:MAG: hypothetical protein KME26_00260 [Oscillatoria princeps RMCB-10]|nr:hypothetical protein [Oscillatoria princeps RMCB-10]